MTNPATTFTCNPGDVISGTDVDTNAQGDSAPSPVFTATAPTTPPTPGVPTTPTITGITFTP